MDSSIIKFLEEDEDESMHSGADVEAFQAALNRDIGGDASTSSQPSDSSAAVLSHESNQTPNIPYSNWQSTGQDESKNTPSQQQPQTEQHSFSTEVKPQDSGTANQPSQNDVKQEPSYHPLHQNQPQSNNVQQNRPEQVSTSTPQTVGMQVPERIPMPKPEPEKMQIPNAESQHLKVQKMGNDQIMGLDQPGNLKNQNKQIPFALLLPALKPHLDKDREMQLSTLFEKLRKNEIVKENFVRLMRNIVGDQVLRLAVAQLQTQPGANQSRSQSQPFPLQHNMRMSVNATASSVAQGRGNFTHQSVNNSSQSHTNVLGQDRDRPSISVPGLSKQQQQPQQQHLHFTQNSFAMHGGNSGTYHPYSGTNISNSGSSIKPQAHDLQMRQISHPTMGATQMVGSTQAMNMMNQPKFERSNPITEPNRLPSGSMSQYTITNKSSVQQNLVPRQPSISKDQTSGLLPSINYVKQEPAEQSSEQQQKALLSNPAPIEQANPMIGIKKADSLEKLSSKVGFSTPSGMVPPNSVSPSITTSIVPPNTVPPSIPSQLDPGIQVGSQVPSAPHTIGVNSRTPPKKPSIGQKKPLETLSSSLPMPSKKQKVSGDFQDQSIEQLNDVTAVSGVNLREEEEQLFSGAKEDSRVSEASRRVVQEEEERLILVKTPLKKKLTEIMAKFGLKNVNGDVERCLSLSVEERMRGLIGNLIRLSKQRVDAEKLRHRTVITSDVRQQIMTMNQKAREEWDRKQAEAEKIQKVNESEGDSAVDGDKEKDDGRVKVVNKANKEEDDKMRTTAANVAARAAVGGDDMLSKWQFMAEQARQKRGGGAEVTGSQATKASATRKPISTSGKTAKDIQDFEKRSGAIVSRTKKKGRNQASVPQITVARSISVKDVITALEREPQMSKSTLIYRLYERTQSDAPTQ